jgi:hypothetical protein
MAATMPNAHPMGAGIRAAPGHRSRIGGEAMSARTATRFERCENTELSYKDATSPVRVNLDRISARKACPHLCRFYGASGEDYIHRRGCTANDGAPHATTA